LYQGDPLTGDDILESGKTPFVSYAQNQEDVLLWRIFSSVATGFYVDVGAAHPEWESVTKAFYDRGWRGINLEPNPHFHVLLEKERARDVNIRALAGSTPGERELHIVGESGLSTASGESIDLLGSHGHRVTGRVVCRVLRLDDVLREHAAGEIHFLKVDAEGMEREVLEGCSFSEFRPKVLVIESTLPETNTQRVNGLRELLFSRGYRFVFFDGLNDYFVACECQEFAEHFAFPVNVLDSYRRASEVYLENRLADQATASTKTTPVSSGTSSSAGILRRIRSSFAGRDQTLSAKDVEWAYRHFLRRPPESEAAVSSYFARCKHWKQLVEAITGLREYEYKKYNLPVLSGNREDLHYFFHIHKTGGVSVHEYLSDVVPRGSLFPGYFEDDLFNMGTIRDFGFFSGHFRGVPLSLKARNVRVATVLRDPVRRGWSHYQHARREPELELFDEVSKNSVETFVFGRLAPFIFGNCQARLLAELSPLSRRFSEGWAAERINDEELYDIAMDGLSKVETVGVTEQLGDFLARLSRAWCLPEPCKDYLLNSDHARIPMEISEVALEKIKELCAVDSRIYEEVAKSFQRSEPDR